MAVAIHDLMPAAFHNLPLEATTRLLCHRHGTSVLLRHMFQTLQLCRTTPPSFASRHFRTVHLFMAALHNLPLGATPSGASLLIGVADL